MAANPSLEDFTPEQIEQMAASYRAALEHPETREVMLRITKKLNPKASIPEVDLKDATRAAVAHEAEERGKLEAQLRERDARDRIRDERQRLRDAGHTTEEVAAIEKLMTDEQKNGNILTYDLAAKYFKNSRETAEPTPHTSRTLNYSLPPDPLAALKKGAKGLRDFGREQASAALDDIRSGRINLPH